MVLCIKHSSGKEVQLSPRVQTRKDLAEMHGSTFEIGDSDHLYHVNDVYAKPSIDTTPGIGLLAILFASFTTANVVAVILFAIPVMVLSKIYFWLDKRAVKRFNESTWF